MKSLILLLVAENNPALNVPDGIFADSSFYSSRSFSQLSNIVRIFFKDQPGYSNSGISLIDFLESPAKAHPQSLKDQLTYIQQEWREYIGDDFLELILNVLDLKQEELKPGELGPDPVYDPSMAFIDAGKYGLDDDRVQFSSDQDWMPNLVLIAKNAFVWLDQLSKKYSRSITRLDQIPDEELAQLSSWGISGLWLIGIWERSSASQKIKYICGNQDAISSAYSLFNYSIASDLGGEEAYQKLASQASFHKIRLAADMVPNHVGIFSDWVINHPDFFLSLDQSPYPAYSFNGPDLSGDSRIGIFLEDKYYSKKDAAVVFKRIDYDTGSELFIYHGNDGTAMPWNDTAQLDFLNPNTRESVIQEIISIARKFSIIRFDAAMTLAKKHYQRLWFPVPGSGGAIPTRSEHGLSKSDFDRLFPVEFWREVVDRIAIEAPDTLLLAEAFWMMEGFFVRTLGMHRVYNSAFMHMLRDEDNQKFKDMLRQTIEYDPQILKRYVNFMNNPDEDTAISQFGSDGKYFGVCVLMATLPGLPLFGHGQIEGLQEKYGMEYHRAYYDETPNYDLIRRHEKEIFPLLRLREIFSDVVHFNLYDVTSNSGLPLSDVIAYSNYSDRGKALIVYHNAWAEVEARIKNTISINNQSITIVDALDLGEKDFEFITFKDHISGLEYIRSYDEINQDGLSIPLRAYDCRVYLDFVPVKDPNNTYQKLHNQLQGNGVENINRKLSESRYEPLISPLIDLNIHVLKILPAVRKNMETTKSPSSVPEHYLQKEFDRLIPFLSDPAANLDEGRSIQLAIDSLFKVAEYFKITNISIIMSLVDIHYLISESVKWDNIDFPQILELVSSNTIDIPSAIQQNLLVNSHVLLEIIKQAPPLPPEPASLASFMLSNPVTKQYLSVNQYQGKTWYHQESMATLIDLISLYFLLEYSLSNPADFSSIMEKIELLDELRIEMIALSNRSNYQADIFMSLSQTSSLNKE
jgi:glycosidase